MINLELETLLSELKTKYKITQLDIDRIKEKVENNGKRKKHTPGVLDDIDDDDCTCYEDMDDFDDDWDGK